MQSPFHDGFLLARLTLGLTLSGMLVVGTAGSALSQENASPPQTDHPSQGIHGPRSIDQELDHLTKELELTAKQREQIRPLLVEHHDRIQGLLDKNPTLSREDLQSQIHAISDQTHHEIEALLTQHQKDLAKAMQRRMHQEDSGQSVPAGTSK
jgi:Spy/CpxP family protein refolding chaperone